MAELLKGVLTNKGLSLVARAQAGTATITFTRFEIGNGDWGASPATADLQAATELKSEKATFDISKCEYVDPSTSLLTLIASNKDNEEGYYVTEVGIYATDGADEVLYAIYVMAQGKGDWFPAHNSLIPSSLVYNCHITVANAESVTIKADPAGLALEADLEATQKEVDDINKALGSADYSALASTITEGLKILQTFKGTTDITSKAIPTASEMIDLLQGIGEASKLGTSGFHNGIYRGKYLGSSVTSAQWAAIKAGTFLDLYIGDYWIINGITWRIAAFDYYLHAGDTECTVHHVTIVPDACLYSAQMNTTNTTSGAYVNSAMRTSNLESAKSTIKAAFGSGHILNHRNHLQNAVTDNYESGGSWYDSEVELMTEANVYGCVHFTNACAGTAWANRYSVDKSQYPLFTLDPQRIIDAYRSWYWLRGVASASDFACAYGSGYCHASVASNSGGVRPAFSIYQS